MKTDGMQRSGTGFMPWCTMKSLLIVQVSLKTHKPPVNVVRYSRGDKEKPGVSALEMPTSMKTEMRIIISFI